MNALKRLLPFFKENWWRYLIGVFFLLVVDIAQLFVPDVIEILIDEFNAGLLTHQRIIFFAIVIIGIWLMIAVGRFFWRFFIMSAGRKLEFEIRGKFFAKLLTLSSNFFIHHKTGSLMALATNDVNAVRMAAGPGVVMAVDSTFMFVAVLIKMFSKAGFQLTGMILLIFPLLFLFVTYFGKLVHVNFKKTQETYSQLTDTTQEIFSGIRVVKAFAQEDLFGQKFEKSNKNNYMQNIKLIKLQSGFRPVTVIITSLAFLLMLFFGGRGVIDGTMTLGQFLAFNMYLEMIIWPMMAFGEVVNTLQRGSASMGRINAVLDEVPEIIDPMPDYAGEYDINKIEFENVSFSYPESKLVTVKNISFTLEKNKKVAIIGNTGSGKTTLINLLLRLYDLDSNGGGNILIDGIPIREVSLKKLRNAVGLVPQDSFLFSRTINENIAFSQDFNSKQIVSEGLNNYEAKNLVFEEVQNVSKIADLHENILQFPQSYNTIVGERGVTLSGGQKQRASIARAIIKKPSILILDDSFSAVDTETEENILTNLKDYNKDCGLLIISHRISSIQGCDEILVLQDGEIVERGNDKSLMQKKGIYYTMAMRQSVEGNDGKGKR